MFAGSIDIEILDSRAEVPVRAHEGDAGFDLIALNGDTLMPGRTSKFPLGIAVAIPNDCVGLVAPRSGLATKHGITLANSPGIIDQGYRGEVVVFLTNQSLKEFIIHEGDRIAQLIVMPIISNPFMRQVDKLSSDTARGIGGFGSTGLNSNGRVV